MPYSVFVRAAMCLLCFTIKHVPRLHCVLFWSSSSVSFLTFTVIIFYLHCKIPVFTALPLSNMLFICISLFQTSQNAHQDWPAGCPPVLPEEIRGWFLSTQQVSQDFPMKEEFHSFRCPFLLVACCAKEFTCTLRNILKCQKRKFFRIYNKVTT